MNPVWLIGLLFASLLGVWPEGAAPDLDARVSLPDGDLAAGEVVERLSLALEAPYAAAAGAEPLLAEPADMSGRELPARRIIEELAENCRILAWLDGRALVCFDLLQSPSLLEADSRWAAAIEPGGKFLRIPAREVLASETHLSIPAALRRGPSQERRSWSRDQAEAERLCVQEPRDDEVPHRTAADVGSAGEKIEP